MEKFRKWITIWLDGGEVRGIHNVTLYTRQECARVHDDLVIKKESTFISREVKEILEKCGIALETCGIGYKAHID